MCGIVATISDLKDVPETLLDCLKRLDYRGYDSAGMAMVRDDGEIAQWHQVGTVDLLCKAYEEAAVPDAELERFRAGIAHTRWATHGVVSEQNTHPIIINNELMLVHNGVIENYEELKAELLKEGVEFTTETDSEVIGHLIHKQLRAAQIKSESEGETFPGLTMANVRRGLRELKGSYAIVVMHKDYPDVLIAACKGAPLVIASGEQARYIASDPQAVSHLSKAAIYMKDGEIAHVSPIDLMLQSASGDDQSAEAEPYPSSPSFDRELGNHNHFVHKEIYETPDALYAVFGPALRRSEHEDRLHGDNMEPILPIYGRSVGSVTTVGCGSSYFAGMVSQYWIEEIMGVPTRNEISSEYRYRQLAHAPDTLLITLSQSGETADTLAVMLGTTRQDYLGRISVSNSPLSPLARAADANLSLNCGPEVGVASTKTVAATMARLLAFVLAVQPYQQREMAKEDDPACELITIPSQGDNQASNHESDFDDDKHSDQADIVPVINKRPLIAPDPDHALKSSKTRRKLVSLIPELIDATRATIKLEDQIKTIAQEVAKHDNIFFLARHILYPIALEGALKMKELAYIHAEAFPSGEMKHGPLALVEPNTLIISLASNHGLIPKITANLSAIHARGGRHIIFTDDAPNTSFPPDSTIIRLPKVHRLLTPFVYLTPIHLLAYHVALARGTPIDKPRNLAKSVTVE